MTHPSPARSRLTFGVTAIALIAVAVGIGWGVGTYRADRRPALQPVASQRGALLYQTACANCHGPDGAGDGVSAVALKPPPRDFAARPWRFDPTKASIRQVILTGIPGTAMPANQGTLTEADIDALVNHVYTLATSRPIVTYEPTQDERLLKAAGFVNLQGSNPPPLTVTGASGRVTKLGDLKDKLVIVHFWGTTCVHCLKEMPHLRELETKYAARGLTVLHVCADAEDVKQAQALLDRHVPGTIGLTDESGLGLARFEVQTLPTVWLIGSDGKVIGRASGAADWRSPGMIQLLEHWLPSHRE